MEKNLIALFKGLEKNLENVPNKNGKKVRYVKELKELIGLYTNLNIPEEFSEKYNDLLKVGTELNEGENYRDIKKMDKFLPMCFYLYYSIRGEANGIMRKLGYCFLATSFLFLVVATPVFQPLLTLLFVAPMFLAIRGLSKGLVRGINIGTTVIEFFALSGFISLYLIIQSIPKYNNFLEGLVKYFNNSGFNLTTGSMNILVIIYSVLACGLVATSVYTVLYTRKYKKLFQ